MQNEQTFRWGDIKLSSDMQISTEWKTQLAAFLFVQVMKNVVTINAGDTRDSVKKKLSAQKLFFSLLPL